MSELDELIRAVTDEFERRSGARLGDGDRQSMMYTVTQQFGGQRVYVPKRAARPAGNLASEARVSGVRPSAFVRSVRTRYAISLRTAYRWVNGR